MGNVVLLDDLTINKIAAGEVIERPASVIKEMVENSIDAGATNISVEIKNGGISYIRINDNGKGIMQEDMELCFERHATSKIRKAEDLETVKSMGFRGEALASIAAIAHVEMISKTKDAETGFKIVIEAGKVLEKEEVGCPVGTSITVTNLFFNTPVRYKFLKKDFTEAGYIEDAITRLALVNPNIAIKLINTGKTVISTNGTGNLKNVIYAIYGKEIAEKVLDVDYEYENIRIKGVVGKPEISRSNRSNQLFFVNKRYIKDKGLTAAAEQAFKGLITIGKYGFLVLNIDMDPSKVDVNVHPAKLEVRFEEESKVFKAVYHAIHDVLLKGDLVATPERDYTAVLEKKEIPEVNKDINNLFAKADVADAVKEKPSPFSFLKKKENFDIEEKNNPIADIYQNKYSTIEKKEETNLKPNMQTHEDIIKHIAKLQQEIEQSKQDKVNSDIPEIKEETSKSENDNPVNEEQDKTQKIEMSELINKLKQEEVAGQANQGFDEMYLQIFGKLPPKEEEKKEEEPSVVDTLKMDDGKNLSLFEEKEVYQAPKYKFIGIAFSTYIILEMDKELYILDQHAAHERILYEKIKSNYYSDNGEKDSQLMLLPDIINLSHKEMDIAKDNMEMFEKAGFMLEEFGENTIKLTGVPNVCINLDTKELFLETLDEINTVARTAKQEIEERFIATVACKAAVKANMALTEEEVDSLMVELLKLPNPFTCPHGRPTAIKMSKYDIERKFSRK